VPVLRWCDVGVLVPVLRWCDGGCFGGVLHQFNVHPRVTTEANINRFRQQLKMLGFSYDWERELSTTEPHYYKYVCPPLVHVHYNYKYVAYTSM
jgi:hypothetical protein